MVCRQVLALDLVMTLTLWALGFMLLLRLPAASYSRRGMIVMWVISSLSVLDLLPCGACCTPLSMGVTCSSQAGQDGAGRWCTRNAMWVSDGWGEAATNLCSLLV